MSGFIEELFYGNIDPQTIYELGKKREKKPLKKLSELEGELTKVLAGEEKEKFLALMEAFGEFTSQAELDSFEMGFRLGARFAYDSFVIDR